MTGLFPPGHVVDLPNMPGRWQVWGKTNEAPGAYFFVPYDDDAQACGIKFVVGKAIERRQEPRPVITVLRTETVVGP